MDNTDMTEDAMILAASEWADKFANQYNKEVKKFKLRKIVDDYKEKDEESKD